MGLTLRRLREIISEELQAELVKLPRGAKRYHEKEWVDPYTDDDGHRVAGHPSKFTGMKRKYRPETSDEAAEADIDEVDEKKRRKKRKKKKKGKKKEYHASDGAVSVLKKYDNKCSKAVKAGKFDWAGKGKWAACQSAHIVATGKPTVQQGAHFASGKGPGGGGKGSHVVEPRKKGKK